MRLRLYHYWRSSSSWRVRWALTYKNIACEYVPVNLLSDEPESEAHLKRNPLGFIPVLEDLDHASPLRYLSESTAIIEFLEEIQPEPRLLPKDPLQRARTRQLAEIINSGTQPLQNMNTFLLHSSDPEEQKRWNQHWIHRGLKAYETLVQETAGKFSMGDSLTYADLFLIPQCYNAKRFEVPLSQYPTVERIDSAALKTESYQKSCPEVFQPPRA
jgi:maleylacetoacetate isomerase